MSSIWPGRRVHRAGSQFLQQLALCFSIRPSFYGDQAHGGLAMARQDHFVAIFRAAYEFGQLGFGVRNRNFHSRNYGPSTGPNQSFARSTYDPSSVITTIRVPGWICGGTITRAPFDIFAGL
ncbi:MAG: hypothetical protein QOG66_3185 [Methylobacteriaceae bacterium]|nr:hypothetical protein [Methylobacteriaceae bacterium]